MNDEEIPNAFRGHQMSPMQFINKPIFEELLKGYLPDPLDQHKVMENYDHIHNVPVQINSFPAAIQFLGGMPEGPALAQKAKDHVMQKNMRLQSQADGSEGHTTLHRGDTRTPSEIKAAGGFHGYGGDLSVDHAESFMKHINEMSRSQQTGAARNWVAETSGASQGFPYVAFGTEGTHKGGHHYEIEVPIPGKAIDHPSRFGVNTYHDENGYSGITMPGGGEFLSSGGVGLEDARGISDQSGDGNKRYETTPQASRESSADDGKVGSLSEAFGKASIDGKGPGPGEQHARMKGSPTHSLKPPSGKKSPFRLGLGKRGKGV